MEPSGVYGKNDRSRFDYETPTTYLLIKKADFQEDCPPYDYMWDVLATNIDGTTSIETYFCNEWEENDNFKRIA